MSKVNIEIDGHKLQVPQGTMVIEAADNAGITIPRFCYHKKLSIAANCRMCLVQVENAPKPMPACATPVSEGMKVQTQSDTAKNAQKAVMEFLLINHPLDCPVCDQGGQCELQDVALTYGKDVSRFTEAKRAVPNPNLGELVATEMTRCIHCTRCVRFGEEVAGLREMGATGRGEHVRIGTFIEQNVESELSGNVIDLCPVGALTSKPFLFTARAWEIKSRKGLAAHDNLGTNVFHHIYQNQVVRTVPRENEALNEVWLSDRDRFSYEGLNHNQRLLEPQIKQNGRWQTVSYEVALKFAAERIQTRIQTDGPSTLGALAGNHCTTEEYYLAQKLMRTLGSKNIDFRLRMTDPHLQADYHAAFSQPLSEFEQNKAFFLIGFHPRKEMPLLNQRIYKATQMGAKVFGLQTYADDARYQATEYLPPKGDLLAPLAQIAKALSEKTNTPVPQSLASIVGQVKSTELAEPFLPILNIEGGKSVIIGEDSFSHPCASQIRQLAAYIAKCLSSKLEECAPGANAQGARLAGFLPHLSPVGQMTLTEPGLNALAMMQKGLRCFVLINCEPEFDCANPRLCVDTLKQADEVICITPYVTDTMLEYANVLLPMVPLSETDGTMVNMYGQLQTIKPVVAPKGQARPAWKILRVLGNFLHLDDFDYNTAQEVMDELAQGFKQAKFKENKIDSILSQTVNTNDYPLGALVRLGPCAMYRVDNVVRRASALQRTHENRSSRQIFVHPLTAKAHDIKNLDVVKVLQDSRAGEESFTLVEDSQVPVGSVLMYGGHDDRGDLGGPFSPIELQKLS